MTEETGASVNVGIRAGAFHVAGHAVISIVQGLELHPPTLPVAGQHNGVVSSGRLWSSRATHGLGEDIFRLYRNALLEKTARCYLAGRIAQRRYNPRSWRRHHDSGDHQKATELLISAAEGSARAGMAWLRLLRIQTEEMVERSWPAVETLADALVRRQILSVPEAHALCWKALGKNAHQYV